MPNDLSETNEAVAAWMAGYGWRDAKHRYDEETDIHSWRSDARPPIVVRVHEDVTDSISPDRLIGLFNAHNMAKEVVRSAAREPVIALGPNGVPGLRYGK
jgi:hypothetical protein